MNRQDRAGRSFLVTAFTAGLLEQQSVENGTLTSSETNITSTWAMIAIQWKARHTGSRFATPARLVNSDAGVAQR